MKTIRFLDQNGKLWWPSNLAMTRPEGVKICAIVLIKMKEGYGWFNLNRIN